MAKLKVEIVTPAKKYFEGEAYMVTVPGYDGNMGFLPGHVGLSTILGEGKVTISNSDNSLDSSAKSFQIQGGYVQVFNDVVTILAEHAEIINN